MDSRQDPVSKSRHLARVIVRKVVTLAVVMIVFGWLYSWASPWAFPREQTAGFGFGMLHGAMMPLSLPSLVIGRDVQIYDDNNTGRIYKIGYICGVDICGLAFIGPLFWRPRKLTSTSSGKSQ
jgi:hypothetical protein